MYSSDCTWSSADKLASTRLHMDNGFLGKVRRLDKASCHDGWLEEWRMLRTHFDAKRRCTQNRDARNIKPGGGVNT